MKTGRGETEIKIDPGQFIFGRKTAAKELRMKHSSVRDRMQKLKNIGNLDITPNTHYSIISINNWLSYQLQPSDIQHATRQASDNQPTTNRQPTDTTKNVKNNKNVKNGKETPLYPPWLDMKLWKQFKEHRQKLRAPMTPEAERRNLIKLEKLIGHNGANQENIIGQSIENGWKGLFKLKVDFQTRDPKSKQVKTALASAKLLREMENGKI